MEILFVLAIFILGILALVTAVRLTLWYLDVLVTWVDTLVIMCGSLIFSFGVLMIWPGASSSDGLVVAGVVISLAVGIAALVVVARLVFIRPNIESVVQQGWIKVHPQVLLQRKTNKAIIDHACAITKMNLPLAEGFYLAGQQTPGRSGIVLQAMATFLLHGMKLSEAYGRYRARSALTLSMMQSGERCGQLPAALQHLQEYFARERKIREQWVPAWWGYVAVFGMFFFCITLFMMVVVIPKFTQIFKDFGIDLPLPTQILIGTCDWLANGTPPGWIVLLVPPALVAGIVMLRVMPRGYPKPYAVSVLADRIAWGIPGWGAKHRYAGYAHAASVLRLGLASGMTMPEAVRGAAALDINIVLRRRFEKLHAMLLRGEPVERAGRRVHLPKRFLWALRDGQDRETLAASLKLIERYYSLVASHWYLLLNSLIWPAIILCIGSVVGFVAFALFSPLVKLIDTAANF